MRNLLFLSFLFISSIVYGQNNLNSNSWKDIIESKSISDSTQKNLKDFLKPKLYGGTFVIDTSYNLNSAIFLSLLNIKEPEFSFNPKEKEVFFLLFDSEYNVMDFKSRQIAYSIIPDGGYVSVTSEVKFQNNIIEVIEKGSSSKNPEIKYSPKENFKNKKKIIYIIENGKINQKKSVVLESESYVNDKELKKIESLDKEELRILRNYYFAKYGYKFKSEDLTEYFKKNLNYYEPKSDNVNDRLTELDKFLIQYILELEKK